MEIGKLYISRSLKNKKIKKNPLQNGRKSTHLNGQLVYWFMRLLHG